VKRGGEGVRDGGLFVFCAAAWVDAARLLLVRRRSSSGVLQTLAGLTRSRPRPGVLYAVPRWIGRGGVDSMNRFVQWLKRLGLAGGLLMLAVYLVFCAYSLPSTVKVHVTGTEISRRDVENQRGEVFSEDVRYVMAEDLDGGPRMFRNEDTGWGWPPYFKFNTGDIAAQANNFATDDRDAVVLVKYYGFRIRMLSMFPNIISMREVSPDHQPIPWATIVVAFAHLVLLSLGLAFVRSRRERPSAES
jgi:hypothetical protein